MTGPTDMFTFSFYGSSLPIMAAAIGCIESTIGKESPL